MKQHIAIVVQRAGKGIVGGSESYAMNLAATLSPYAQVSILTTTAQSHETWQPYYPAGIEVLEPNLTIHRFAVPHGRHQDLYRLNAMLTDGLSPEAFSQLSSERHRNQIERIKRMPLGWSEAWVRATGPDSPDLLTHLKINSASYDAIIFMTYLYATTYFGIQALPALKKAFLVSTYHDEPAAYLPVFQQYRNVTHLFLTAAEKRLAQTQLFQTELNSAVIGFGMTDKWTPPVDSPPSEPYLLYAGRLEAYKGVQWLYDCFDALYDRIPNLKLYVIGQGPLQSIAHPGIIYKGFVDEAEKLRLMQGALAFIHPSAYESLGIVLLEAFMMGTPGLVNAQCAVLADHIAQSNGGAVFNSVETLEAQVADWLANPHTRYETGKNARAYYLNFYSQSRYVQTLLETLALNS